MGWYVIRGFGNYYDKIKPAKGPFRSFDEAMDAMRRFRERAGAMYGELLNARNYRILGPFRTRREAEMADMSDGPIAWP